MSEYTAEELSGLLGDGLVRLSIIPSAHSLDYGDVKTQRQQLTALQKEQPALNYRVPSMLDAVMYWYTLCARGIEVDYDSSFIKHFDAPVRWGGVPASGGNGDMANLDGVDEGHARLALG